ncbi:hypothetical protein PT286_04285 [Neisseriaceae bacterium ESL0693]|nr:hypothetical protein [Neisseriaceae bacterium ESL0693]
MLVIGLTISIWGLLMFIYCFAQQSTLDVVFRIFKIVGLVSMMLGLFLLMSRNFLIDTFSTINSLDHKIKTDGILFSEIITIGFVTFWATGASLPLYTFEKYEKYSTVFDKNKFLFYIKQYGLNITIFLFLNGLAITGAMSIANFQRQ